MWRLLRSQVFSGPMCSDQSYIQTSEWTLQLFSFFFLQNHSFTISWVCVLLSFAKNLCDSFISLVVHSLYCKTLWRPVWANCDLWTESWNANSIYFLTLAFWQNSPQNWMEILFFNQQNLFRETHGREVEFGELNSVNCVERTVRLPETAFGYHSLYYCLLKGLLTRERNPATKKNHYCHNDTHIQASTIR